MPDPAIVLEAGAKALLYASLLVVIGASAARWLLLPRAVAEIGERAMVAIEHSVARVALLAAVVVLAASASRVWTHTVTAFGFDGARSWDSLKLIALRSRWGYGWRPEAIAACALMLASVATVWHRAVWPLATLAAIALAATMPLLGHASGNAVRVALHAVHILAGGLWLGTLAVVLLIRLPPSSLVSIESPRARQEVRLLLLRHFSPIALSGCGAVVVAGAAAAWLYVGTLPNLWMTVYGRVLMVKVGLVGAASICGYVNWRRLRGAHMEGESSPSIILFEATLAVAVVIVTAFLTEIGHPG